MPFFLDLTLIKRQMELTEPLLTVAEKKAAETAPLSPYQLEQNTQIGSELLTKIDLLKSARGKILEMEALRKSTQSKLDNSYFAHIKFTSSTFIRNVIQDQTARDEIQTEMKKTPELLAAYKRFELAFNHLEAVQEYFGKTPKSSDESFANAFKHFKNTLYNPEKNKINEILKNCGPYKQFVSDVVAVCEGTAPVLRRAISPT